MAQLGARIEDWKGTYQPTFCTGESNKPVHTAAQNQIGNSGTHTTVKDSKETQTETCTERLRRKARVLHAQAMIADMACQVQPLRSPLLWILLSYSSELVVRFEYLQRRHKVCNMDLSPARGQCRQSTKPASWESWDKALWQGNQALNGFLFFLPPHWSALVAVGIPGWNKTLDLQMVYRLRRVGPKPMTKILNVRHGINLEHIVRSQIELATEIASCKILPNTEKPTRFWWCEICSIKVSGLSKAPLRTC